MGREFFNDGLPMSVGDLQLRRLTTEDRWDVFVIDSAPETHLYDYSEPSTMKDVDGLLYEQLNKGDFALANTPLRLACEYLPDEKVVGLVHIHTDDFVSRRGSIGYRFNPAYWGRGLATQAVTALVEYGFSTMKLHRIRAGVDVRNERSWKLLERIGMRREAHFRQHKFYRGVWIDDYVYAILEHEWRDRDSEPA